MYPFFGEPLNSSSKQTKNTQPALMTWEVSCSFQSKIQAVCKTFWPCCTKPPVQLVSCTLSGDIDKVMLIVLNRIPDTTIIEKGGQALCLDSQMPMS